LFAVFAERENLSQDLKEAMVSLADKIVNISKPNLSEKEDDNCALH
jgi:hypothetical protein